jgi:hypothetical protein
MAAMAATEVASAMEDTEATVDMEAVLEATEDTEDTGEDTEADMEATVATEATGEATVAAMEDMEAMVVDTEAMADTDSGEASGKRFLTSLPTPLPYAPFLNLQYRTI